MSKVDAMRALREARRSAATRAGVQLAPVTGRPPAKGPGDERPAPSTKPALRVVAPDETAAEPAAEALCGHRNIGGRSCTRELDHVKNGTKNHRYG